MKKRKHVILALIGCLILAGCVETIPREALQLTQESLELRHLQTRSFDTSKESHLLTAGAGVLQDLGFTIDESETHLGVIVASKDRDAVEAGQVAGAILVAALTGVAVPIDEKQKIRASLVTRPTGEVRTNLRVTFQRVVWNTQGQVSKVQSIEDPKIYQEFFEKLSKAVFLEANKI